MSQGLHESVVLSVAQGTAFVLLAVDLDLDIGTGLQTVGRRHHIADEFHLVVGAVVFQHVADDIGQVLLRHDFLLVAQFGDTFRHAARLFGSQFQSQLLKVLGYVGTPGVLAQGIFALTSETLGDEFVVIEFVLCVAIGMDASDLRKHILAHDGLVGSHRNAAEALDHARDVVQLTLDDVGLCMELVLQNGLHRGQRGIAATFAQSVDGDVQSAGSTEHSGQRVRHSQIVVVMGMEVEMHVGVALQHLAKILDDLQRVHHTQRVWQHEAFNRGVR